MAPNYNFRCVLIILLLMCGPLWLSAQQKYIQPGELWPDNNGRHINAHGAGITKINNTYYWYGEEYPKGADSSTRFISCYTSKDLMNWTSKGTVLQMQKPDSLLWNWYLLRPKVYYNKTTKKFVMYLHYDDINCSLAQVGLAVSDKATGPFVFIRAFRPLGMESRDIGQFIDDDGTAYLIFEDRPTKGFHIARLSANYMDVVEDVCLVPAPLEGGAIVHYKGLYYATGSELTGWAANPNRYGTARSLKGPWTAFTNMAPPATNTYGSQSTYMLKITGTKQTTVIFLADQWKEHTQWDSRYLWMPLQIGNGKLKLPEPKAWSINIKTGVVTYKPKA